MKCKETDCPHCDSHAECVAVYDASVTCNNPDFVAERNKMTEGTDAATYRNACASIFNMAVEESKQVNRDPEYSSERLKAYRIALGYLKPDLKTMEIYDEIERCAALEWNCKTHKWEQLT